MLEIKKPLLLLNTRISRNILFWLLFSFFHYYPRQNIPDYFAILGICLVFYGIPVYINNLFLIDRFLLRQKYFIYGLLLSALLFFTVEETYYINVWAIKILPFLSYTNPMASSTLPLHVFHIMLLFTFLALGKFFGDALKNQRSLELLQQQKLETELESLKSQINPHFLFNALNTIYGMARRTDQKTANAVITLSDILRHNLYEGTDDYISIDKEIQLIRQYISFSQLRMHDKDNISLDIEQGGTTLRIRPLLLLPFIENAIKHGLETYPGAWVKIVLKVHNDVLDFECLNSYSNNSEASASDGKGIGLKNVKRRLDLCYPGRHNLQITHNDNKFSVILKIQLL